MKIGLVGCVKTKLPHRAGARDLYTSPLFRARRAWAESRCDSWFILSAKHGLVAPSKLLEPYDETLSDLSSRARSTWSAAVVEKLRRELGSLRSHDFEIHAGQAYTDFGLVEGLLAGGARVQIPTKGLGLGRQLQFYSHGERSEVAPDAATAWRRPEAQPRYAAPPGAKYEALGTRIKVGPSPLTLTFQEIDALVDGLPNSSRKHRAWWANDATHSQARAWLAAGRQVINVNLRSERVTFG